MLKPNNYDATPVQGDYEVPELGGHHATVLDVKLSKTKTDKDMLVISFDFAQNDKQAGFFMKQYKDDVRPEKKWPRGGTAYVVCVDNEGKTSKSYKTFCTAWGNSNGKEVKWLEDDAAWCAQFKNTKIGTVYGLVHSVYNNKESVRPEMRWFCSDDKADTVSIPNEKGLFDADKQILQNQQVADEQGFMNIPDGIQEELPF